MIIEADYIIEGFEPTNLLSNTTSKLFFDTDNNHFYINIYDDKKEECITRIFLDDILHALNDIIS